MIARPSDTIPAGGIPAGGGIITWSQFCTYINFQNGHDAELYINITHERGGGTGLNAGAIKKYI